ncbi:hypothetical protein HPB50_023220 [Hyalomma asiaticum]|uniref:Uncharacterized protein n=1 Tax=Hyalomma asiaticum TaxID=266040 RepID=A0ACB7SVY9_HYAAI|nr:hypothetical protein HPB50_023220 [Hyalomma asiaticum]
MSLDRTVCRAESLKNPERGGRCSLCRSSLRRSDPRPGEAYVSMPRCSGRRSEISRKTGGGESLYFYAETSDTIKRDHLRNRVKTYMDRAEKIKEQVRKEKAAGTYHEQIRIESGSVGHSYDQTFGHLLDDMVTFVEVDDAYVRSVQNFVRLCELLKKKCSHLKTIKLTTGLDQRDQQSQLDRLSQIKTSLADHGIVMTLEFSETLHDREIR